MKITFDFKGSIFGQKEKTTLEFETDVSVYIAIQHIAHSIPSLQSLLFKDGAIRTDILIIVDKIDVKTMDLMDKPLQDGQVITVLPLAHGG